MAVASFSILFDAIIVISNAKTWRNKRNLIFVYLIPFILNETLLKNYFKQPRPALACVNSYGMPSGHATSASTNFVMVSMLLMKGMMKRPNVGHFYLFWMPLQAYSRIYLHYHTVDQVLAGFTLGIIASNILLMFFPITTDKESIEYQVLDEEIVHLIEPAQEMNNPELMI
uniref:Phosphatidic acid phosphatase type 2/haloperoxidase domain-containing protein n=1 Tax=Euplotes crassus TaxID=5936 RepID=A0A7S3KH36_EUPCR|mmetsp:Transcript_27167/g.27041  ORF Transcript_27167/g.27041 Transcript_27167/m.27041 type:complete len:171 (+) Transcript_27167:129-641(+)